MLVLQKWTKLGRASHQRNPHVIQRIHRGYSKSAAISTPKTVLIVGSNGVLGSTLAGHLKEEYDCYTIGADITDSNVAPSLDSFLLVSASDIQESLHSSLPSHLPTTNTTHTSNTSNTQTIDAIICTNGGYTIDNPTNPTSTHTQMMTANYQPVIAASSLLSTYLTPHHGLFLATGASSALAPSPPPFTAYNCSKAAVHHFLHSLGVATGNGLGGSRAGLKSPRVVEYRRNHSYLDTLTVVGVLPSVMDTPYNRSGISNEKEGKEAKLWTPPMDIAREIGRWVVRPELRPHSGSLVKVLTRKKGTRNDGDSYETEFHLVR